MDDLPFELHHVYCEGLKATKRDVIDRVFADAHKGTTLGVVVGSLNAGVKNLRSLGVFKEVRLELASCPVPAPTGKTWLHRLFPWAHRREPEVNFANGADVHLKVEEDSRLRCGISANIESSEASSGKASMNLEGRILNVFGRAEQLSGSVGTDVHKLPHFQVSFFKPLLFLRGIPRFRTSISRISQAFSDVTCTRESINGISFSLGAGSQDLSYDVALRNVILGADAPEHIWCDAGPSIKSSLKHTFCHDRRDDQMLPTKGYALQVSHELAGLGGTIRFLKQMVSAQLHFCLHPPISLALNFLLKGGVILSPDATRINDRFFVGGESLRGFEAMRVNPGSEKYALGGDAYVSATAAASVSIPRLPSTVRAHAFVNAGNVATLQPLREFGDVLRRARVATGVGLVLGLPVCRLEFNACMPLVSHAYDTTRRFQVGLWAGLF